MADDSLPLPPLHMAGRGYGALIFPPASNQSEFYACKKLEQLQASLWCGIQVGPPNAPRLVVQARKSISANERVSLQQLMHGKAGSTSHPRMQTVMDVNLWGMVRVLMAALPLLPPDGAPCSVPLLARPSALPAHGPHNLASLGNAPRPRPPLKLCSLPLAAYIIATSSVNAIVSIPGSFGYTASKVRPVHVHRVGGALVAPVA